MIIPLYENTPESHYRPADIAFCTFAGNTGLVSPSQRSSMYPEDKYLVSFKSDFTTRDADPSGLAETLLKLAKSQLVEQIRVTIKSSTSIQIENLNTNSREIFQQAGTATSEANLTGLKTETWINKKKKEFMPLQL